MSKFDKSASIFEMRKRKIDATISVNLYPEQTDKSVLVESWFEQQINLEIQEFTRTIQLDYGQKMFITHLLPLLLGKYRAK